MVLQKPIGWYWLLLSRFDRRDQTFPSLPKHGMEDERNRTTVSENLLTLTWQNISHVQSLLTRHSTNRRSETAHIGHDYVNVNVKVNVKKQRIQNDLEWNWNVIYDFLECGS